MARAKGPDLADVAGGVARVMDDPRIVWFPVKHFSAACAHHVEQFVEADAMGPPAGRPGRRAAEAPLVGAWDELVAATPTGGAVGVHASSVDRGREVAGAFVSRS